MRLDGTLAFARVALGESVSAGLPWAAAVYGALLLGAGWLLPTVSEGDRARTLVEATVALNFVVTMLAIAPLAAVTLAREFTLRVELTIGVKPVSALSRVLGKFSGLALAASLLVASNALIGYGVLATIDASALSFAHPSALVSGEARVFATQADSQPRPMRTSEAFDGDDPARPVWVFRDHDRGTARLVLHMDVRQLNYTTPTGHVYLVARRGQGPPIRRRYQLYADRPIEAEVGPPGAGPLSVVVDPVGGAVIYPRADSVRHVSGRGALWSNYVLTHLGVLAACWLAITVALFFSATCGSRVALLYAAVVLVACASVGPMRSFARVLGDGDMAIRLLEQSMSSAGEDVQAAPSKQSEAPAGWTSMRLLLSATSSVLPDLGLHDHRAQLVGGVQIAGPQLDPALRQLALYLPAGLALAAFGLAHTGREGRS